MITARPYDDTLAMVVLSGLDPFDLIEAGLVRGAQPGHLALFADWRLAHQQAILSAVFCYDKALGGNPFAVLMLGNTGQAGVAQAALLSRDHGKHRRALVNAARFIRNEMKQFCCDNGIHRIEARSWSDHPTAANFLRACGFVKETTMQGFGVSGTIKFDQFACIPDDLKGKTKCVSE